MTELVDKNTVYCNVEDVEYWIREETNTNNIFYNDAIIQERIKENSEWIDRYTKEAWRTRNQSEKEIKIHMTREQQQALRNTLQLGFRSGKRHIFDAYSKWIDVYVDRSHIQTINKIENPKEDKIYNLDSSEYRIVSEKDGYVQIKLSAIRDIVTSVDTDLNVRQIQERVVVDYDYGRTEVDDHIKKACALLTASDLIGTDYYGSQITDDTEINLNELSTELEERAEKILDRHK